MVRNYLYAYATNRDEHGERYAVAYWDDTARTAQTLALFESPYHARDWAVSLCETLAGCCLNVMPSLEKALERLGIG